MSAAERTQFAQLVQPEVRSGEGSTGHKNDFAHARHEQTAHHEPTAERKDETGDEKPKPEETEPKKEEEGDDDSDIHFLGFSKIDIEGREYEAGHVAAMVDGEERHVYYVDLDNDDKHEFDIAIRDTNRDGKLTMDESMDVSQRHLSKEEFAFLSLLDGESGGAEAELTAHNTQADIAPEMPDYVNDANTNI